MAHVFELYRIGIESTRDSYATREEAFWLGDDGMDFQKTLNGKYGSDNPFLLDKLSRAFFENQYSPWAIIFLDVDYPITEYLLKLRSDRNDYRLSGYHLEPSQANNIPPPPISVISIKDKETLLYYAKLSPLFAVFMESLRDKSEQQHWALFADPLDEELLAKLQ